MKKKIIGLILIIFLISGCQKKANELDKVSEAIINFHQDYNYDISNLSKENQEVLQKFKEQEKKQNKVVNITRLNLFNNYLSTNKSDSFGVYKKDNYYIKYRDLKFIKINDKDYIATICVNGYEIDIPKRNLPILYDETKNINYQYRLMQKTKVNNSIRYYYRSYGDGSMLTIEYVMDNDKIKNITLLYNDYYLLEESEPITKEESNTGFIIFVLLSLLIIGIFLIRFIIKFSRNKRY